MRACRHEHLRRSRRRSWERLYGLIRLRPYRCSLCHKRMLRYAGRAWLELPLLAVALVLGALLWREYAPAAPEPDRSLALATEPRTVDLPLADAPLAAPEPRPVSGFAQAPDDVRTPTGPAPSPAPPAETMAAADPEPALPERPPAAASTAAPTSAPRQQAGAQAPARPPRLRSLLARESGDRFLLELLHDGPRIRPRLIRLANPPRLILDLAGDWQAEEALLQRRLIDGSIVRRVRVGLHPEKLRIVLDLGRAEGLRQKLDTASGRVELSLLRAAGD